MTIGIYRLVFNNTTKCYIGQSINIEKRYLQHLLSMRNRISNDKLNAAYLEYGKPTLDILVVCKIDELDICEDEAIEIFNSVDNGFNIYRFANQTPCILRGENAPNARYTKQQIVEVFELLTNSSDDAFSKISELTKVSIPVISKISCGTLHNWLKEEYPDKYTVLLNRIGTRSRALTIISDKLSAKSKGIKYPKIESPIGLIYTVDNAYRFAREHNLAGNHLTEVLNGHRKSHKGWKACQEEQAL